jgi:outer membrane protein TolC
MKSHTVLRLHATLAFACALVCAVRAQAPNQGPGVASAQGPMAPVPDPLDLRGAIRYAVDHNYLILQSREQIRQQEGVIIQVESASIPNVSANGGYQRNQASISGSYPAETSEWEIQLKATQALFAGGGIKSSIQGAKLGRDAAVAQLQGTINAALLDVRTRFYNVLLAREKVGVQEENVKLFERELQDAQNQFKAGSVSNFEVLRAEVSLANAQPDLITARNDYRIAIEQLRQSLGVPAGPRGTATVFPEVVGSLDVTPESYELEAALTSAHEHRPELANLSKLQEAGEQSVATAKSNYYPNLAAFGEYEWIGLGQAQGGNYNANGWLFGLQSTWSIFDGRATAGRVRQARSLVEQARLSYSSEELAIDVEVRQALSSLEEAAELVAASKKTVGEAEEALRLANARYHAGTTTQLDVLTSQVSLTQARTNELQANYTYLVASAAMRKAVGRGDALVGD